MDGFIFVGTNFRDGIHVVLFCGRHDILTQLHFHQNRIFSKKMDTFAQIKKSIAGTCTRGVFPDEQVSILYLEEQTCSF